MTLTTIYLNGIYIFAKKSEIVSDSYGVLKWFIMLLESLMGKIFLQRALLILISKILHMLIFFSYSKLFASAFLCINLFNSSNRKINRDIHMNIIR